MSAPFLGEIRMFGFNFAPRGWALCQGQLLSISQNSALFSLLGTTYGGNGIQTFQLPNLQSRVPLGMGTSPGLSSYVIGEVTGTENVTLLESQLPSHNHTVAASGATGTSTRPSGGVLARSSADSYAPTPDATTMSPTMIGLTGSNIPVSILQPVLAMNFCIALTGIFPSRN